MKVGLHRVRKATLPPWTRALSVGTLVAVLATGCGDSNDTSSSGSGDSSGETNAAAQGATDRLEPYLTDGLDNDILDLPPLPEKPPAGKKVYFVNFNQSAAVAWEAPFQDAMDALDWEGTILQFDPTNPNGASDAVAQAVAAGADYIFTEALSAEGMGEGLEKAKAAGIPVMIASTNTKATGASGNGVYSVALDVSQSVAINNTLNDYAIADSNGKANILHVDLGELPFHVDQVQPIEDHVAKECPDCSISELHLSFTQVADAASVIVSQLRAQPEIKYVLASYGQLIESLRPALESAGLDDIQLLTSGPLPSQNAQIKTGEYAAIVPYAYGETAWYSVDAMARLAVGGPDALDPAYEDMVNHPPYVLWTAETVPDDTADYNGPTDYQDQFKEIWQL